MGVIIRNCPVTQIVNGLSHLGWLNTNNWHHPWYKNKKPTMVITQATNHANDTFVTPTTDEQQQ